MDHVDVLILGAGLSGIGAACHLRTERPGTSYAVLEARDTMGGTWDLFRYPGVRSDSDMFTLGYSFEPWAGTEALADGASILEYIRTTARTHGVEDRITYRRRAVSASWSTPDARWTVEIEHTDTGEREQVTCGFLWGNTGYYRYDHGYRPRFPGEEDFTGPIVHPQEWPEDLDWSGKRVVVIGSGATAVTLVPALAERAAHVTMLQRSPTYIVSRPAVDTVADALRRHLPARLAHRLVRARNIVGHQAFYQLSRRRPEFVKRIIRKGVVGALPEGYDVDTHFAPRYDPWDQRLCLVPDGDLFEAIASGQVDVVTDTVRAFTAQGIRLDSGAELAADIIVTATGLRLQFLGGMSLDVDGVPADPAELVTFKGALVCGVPNLASTFGYTNSSWTLKADLIAGYVCRLLATLEACGMRQCTPVGPEPGRSTSPFLDLAAGYVERGADDLPRQGPSEPWRVHQSYLADTLLLGRGPVSDGVVLSNPVPTHPVPTHPVPTDRVPADPVPTDPVPAAG